MKTCTRCGASAYVDADTYCDHTYREPPEPEVRPSVLVASDYREHGFVAFGPIQGEEWEVEHPTREGAIALWQERWTWAPVVRVLAERLLGPPAIRVVVSEEQRAAIVAALEKLGSEWAAPITGAFRPMSAFYERNEDIVDAINEEITRGITGGYTLRLDACDPITARLNETTLSLARALDPFVHEVPS